MSTLRRQRQVTVLGIALLCTCMTLVFSTLQCVYWIHAYYNHYPIHLKIDR